jgi:D-alanine-D-alanine ligase
MPGERALQRPLTIRAGDDPEPTGCVPLAPMKITVLTYLERENARKRDPVVDQVAEALQSKGHEVRVLGVHGDIHKLIDGLTEPERPDLVFNLMETFGTSMLGAVGVVGLLDLLGLRYVGGGPGEFYLQEDKALSKKLLAFDGIKYPDFAVFSKDADLETGGNLRMPLFVKPLRMDASIGIDGKSLVNTAREMMERVVMIHEKVGDSALVEEYIEGRELFVGVLGNTRAVALPPIEVDFTGFPEGKPKILDSKAKWKKSSAEYKGTNAVIAKLEPELEARVQRVALDACRALRVRDYGRVDLRVTDTGEIFVIEVNASCYLEKESEFAVSAQSAGLEFPDLVEKIVEHALERYPEKKAAAGKS